MGIERWTILIKERISGAVVAQCSSSALTSPLLAAEWVLGRYGGCLGGEFRFKKDGFLGWWNVLGGMILEVRIVEEGAAVETLFYTGSIQEKTSNDASQQEAIARTVGIWNELGETVILEYYEGEDVDDLIVSIFGNYYAGTNLLNSSSEISIASPYAVGDFEAEYIKWSQAIGVLAQLQSDVEYGVDQNRKLYFRDLDTTVQERFWVGKDLAKYDPILDMGSICNHVLGHGKKFVGGAPFTLSYGDALRIASDGRKSRVLSLPQLADLGDVYRYMQRYVEDWKGGVTRIETDVLPVKRLIWPTGKAKITKLDGTTSTQDINEVQYWLTPDVGLSVKVGLGSLPAPDFSQDMVEVGRQVVLASEKIISNVHVEHSRGEEWIQKVRVNARRSGNYNVFTDSFANTKNVDEAASYNLYHDKKRSFLGCPFGYTKSKVITRMFDIDRAVNTIRVHADTDFYGRIDFSHKGDIEEFFTDYTTDNTIWSLITYWIESDGKAAAENTWASWFCRYGEKALPASYTVKFGLIDPLANNIGVRFYFNYVDPSNYNYVVMQNGLTYHTIRLYSVVAGTPTQLGSTYNELKDADIEVAILARNAPTVSRVYIYRGGVYQGQINTTALPMAANNEIGPQGWYNGGGVAAAYLDYMEIQEIGDLDVWVSRDNGTTWTQATIVHGENNVDVDISGQPSGTEIVLKAEITHPGRLYGLGWSFTS